MNSSAVVATVGEITVGNNATYRALDARFRAARPYFEKARFQVFNCNRESGLKAFPYKSFEDAVSEARLPIDVAAERTEGLYDRAKPEVQRR